MKLIKPNKKYARSWHNLLKELDAEKARGFWNVPKPPTIFKEYQKRTEDHSKGENLPAYWVPASTFWLIDGTKVVGHTNIRHRLTKKLRNWGGNIGYAIRSTEHQKGYGTKILELALKKAKKMGLKKVLVTSLDKNTASQKIIEKNGGKLINKVKTEEGLARRYRINL